MKINDIDIRIHEGRACIVCLNKRGNVTSSKDISMQLLDLIADFTVSDNAHCIVHENSKGTFLVQTTKLTEDEVNNMKTRKELQGKKAMKKLQTMYNAFSDPYTFFYKNYYK
jgi:hypothetical protein